SRTIITSQPDVACDVCERRLLRGEQPEIFLAAGQRRTVCELCVPRAAHAGWQREAELGANERVSPRPRRARGLLERLRTGTRAPDGPYDRAGEDGEDGDLGAHGAFAALGESGRAAAAPISGLTDGPLERAVAMFNAGEYPRRIGGVAR